MSSTIFWDITPCSSACHLLSRWYLWSVSWSWRWYAFPKRLLTFNELHGIISHRCENLRSCNLLGDYDIEGYNTVYFVHGYRHFGGTCILGPLADAVT
jgi:hypothetical protein